MRVDGNLPISFNEDSGSYNKAFNGVFKETYHNFPTPPYPDFVNMSGKINGMLQIANTLFTVCDFSASQQAEFSSITQEAWQTNRITSSQANQLHSLLQECSTIEKFRIAAAHPWKEFCTDSQNLIMTSLEQLEMPLQGALKYQHNIDLCSGMLTAALNTFPPSSKGYSDIQNAIKGLNTLDPNNISLDEVNTIAADITSAYKSLG